MNNTSITINLNSIDKIRKIPCNILNERYDSERIAELVADDIRTKGFPYYKLSDEQIEKILIKLYKYPVEKLELPNNELQQNMLGLNLANYFHPQMWSVPCRNRKTPMDIFNNRELLVKAILKRIKYSDSPLADFNIRKSLKIFSGAQSVSNFRPTIAKWVYEKFGGERTLDPCAGYSGRLIGAWTANVKEYTGIDPCVKTISNGVKANKIISKVVQKMNSELSTNKRIMRCQLVCSPFEDFITKKYFDSVFTSPPYFNIEQYSTEETQSYIRYPTYEEWIEGFLRILIEKSYLFLRKGGYFIINIGGERLIRDTKEIADSVFGNPILEKQMRLSLIMGHGKKKCQSHKLEPLIIYKK